MSANARRRTERIVWSRKNGKAVTHGIQTGYRIHGCGCDDCWNAFAASKGYRLQRSVQDACSDKAVSRPES